MGRDGPPGITLMDYVELALKLWPLVEKLIALKQANPGLTEAEARAELTAVVSALEAKILADQAAHPGP